MSKNLATIQAWETEDATMVVWGTHDPTVAAETANAWYRENIGEPLEDGTLMDAEDFTADDAKYWGRPDAPEHEVWTRDMWSKEPKIGSVPYMAVTR